MPKGVEHRATQGHGWNPAAIVSNSVMPKGVEHLDRRHYSQTMIQASNSVMPKGVEHRSNFSLPEITFCVID